MLATFTISGLWHGPVIGNFYTFIQFVFIILPMQTFGKTKLDAYIRQTVPSFIVHTIQMLVCHAFLAYCEIGIQLHHFDKIYRVLSNIYFLPTIASVILGVTAYSLPK